MDKITLSDVGGARVNARPVKNPTTQMGASDAMRLFETICQGSFTSPKTTGTFVCTTTTGAVDAADISHESHWGESDATKPSIEQTETGRYTLTFPASWVNGLGDTESIALARTICLEPRTGDAGDNLDAKVVSFASNVVTIKVESPQGTLADQGNSSSNDIIIDWAFR